MMEIKAKTFKKKKQSFEWQKKINYFSDLGSVKCLKKR